MAEQEVEPDAVITQADIDQAKVWFTTRNEKPAAATVKLLAQEFAKVRHATCNQIALQVKFLGQHRADPRAQRSHMVMTINAIKMGQ